MKTRCASRMETSFWSMNREMTPAHKVSFIREIDATLLDRARLSVGRASYTAMVVKAAAHLLLEFPYLNRGIFPGWLGKRLVEFESTDIAVAVERRVPNADAIVYAHVLRDVEHRDCRTLHTDLMNLSDPNETQHLQRWQNFLWLMQHTPTWLAQYLIGAPKYSPRLWQEHRGGACFVNSPAKYGVDWLVADMIWPLTFSFGWVKERPWVVDSTVQVRRTMPLIMIFDRRIMQGALAAQAFNRFAQILETADPNVFAGRDTGRWSAAQVQTQAYAC